jgi:hypothetical protein
MASEVDDEPEGARAPDDQGQDAVQNEFESIVDQLDDDDSHIGGFDPDAIDDAHAAELGARLIDTVDVGELDDPLDRINNRSTLRSRFSAFELGLHDGLGGIPKTAKAPPAVIAIRDERFERKAAIRLAALQNQTRLEALLEQRTLEVTSASHDLNEAMYRLRRWHPRGADVGYFASEEEALERTARLADSPPDDNGNPPDESTEPTDAEAATIAETEPASTVQPEATIEQRIAAERELGWSIKPYWFWIGSTVLFAAEFPFMKAVVRQLLLERRPAQWLQILATVSITAGFLVATKLTGILLRRAQSILLLAATINPSRRPLLARLVRQRHSSQDSQVSNPTEAGLRYGAWYRLMLAGSLFLLMLAAVVSIASYRSDAANALAEQAKVETNGADQFSSQASASRAQNAETIPDVSQDTLQHVFLSIGLLNVVGAVALAWASTEGTYDHVGSDRDDSAEGELLESEPIEQPDAHETKHRRRRRGPGRATRRQQAARTLVADVTDCRQRLREAKVRRAAVEKELEHQDERAERLLTISSAQCALDESTYWWANRSGRALVTSEEVDLRLANLARGTESPTIDLTET